MRRIQLNQGFTLVELIVVITILAILGTIGFISLQGYSGQSRDTKRVSDVRILASTINIRSTEWITRSAFVANPTSAAITLANALVAWTTSTTGDYFAGTPNYQVFSVDPNTFRDGLNEYRIAVSNRAGWVYQLATTLERASPAGKTGYVNGTYNPRNAAAWTSSSLPITSVNVTDDTITLNPADINKFKAGDSITIASGLTNLTPTAFTIASISASGLIVKVNENITVAPTVVWTIGLGTVLNTVVPEIGGLIRDSLNPANPVTTGTSVLPYP